MNKFKYKLVENEESPENAEGGEETTGGGGNNTKAEYDLVLTPGTGSDVDDCIVAFEDINNYGIYLSNLRNTKADLKTAIENHFGPSVPMVKRAREKKGEKFAVKSKQAIDDFIKKFTTKPNLLFYDKVGDKLIFPKGKNPPKETTKKIIKQVLGNVDIEYKLSEKEQMDETLRVKKAIKESISSVISAGEKQPSIYTKKVLDYCKKEKIDPKTLDIKQIKDIINKKIGVGPSFPHEVAVVKDLKKMGILTEIESSFKIDVALSNKIYDILITSFPEIKNKYTQSAFFSLLNDSLTEGKDEIKFKSGEKYINSDYEKFEILPFPKNKKVAKSSTHIFVRNLSTKKVFLVLKSSLKKKI